MSRLKKYTPLVVGGVIGLEGCCGSGKSTLAEELSNKFSGVKFSTDDFIKIKDGNVYYVDRIDFEKLKSHIQQAQNSNLLILIEGICLRDTLEKLQLSLNTAVYIKKLSPSSNLWHDGFEIENFIAGKNSPPEPFLSDMKYHSRIKPQEICDFVYEWSEYS